MEKNPTILTVVAAALVRSDGNILLQKRPEGKAMQGLWEFPGGKVEGAELPESALVRELAEELDICVLPENLEPATFVTWPLGVRHLSLSLYICREWAGEPKSQEQADIMWVSLSDMATLHMPPADYPLVSRLKKLL